GTVLQSNARRAISQVVDAVRATGRVHDLRSPLALAGAQLISPEKRSAIVEFGGASAGRALNKTIGRDFSRAESLSIPLTLVILLLAFGALMAAFMPLG